MNKRKILYAIALLLSLIFICIVGLSQKPVTKEDKKESEQDSVDIVTEIETDNQSTNQQPIITIHQEEIEMANEQRIEEETKEEEVIEESIDIIVNYENSYKEYQVPSNRGFKSYMSYKAITSKSSPQYKLQNQFAYTGEYGIRQVNERFCVAIGTFTGAKVGTYIDLILENCEIIPCIVSDFKADIHTDSNNIVTSNNGCVSEFLVDKGSLYSTAKQMGDVSYCKSEWRSPVKTIRVYEENVFDE